MRGIPYPIQVLHAVNITLRIRELTKLTNLVVEFTSRYSNKLADEFARCFAIEQCNMLFFSVCNSIQSVKLISLPGNDELHYIEPCRAEGIAKDLEHQTLKFSHRMLCIFFVSKGNKSATETACILTDSSSTQMRVS